MRNLMLIPILMFASLVSAQPATQPTTKPAVEVQDEMSISKSRLQQTTEATFFYTEVQTTLEDIAKIAGPTIDAMMAACEKAGNESAGPVTFVYFGASEDPKKTFRLQVGMLVSKDAKESGDFKVRKLESVKAMSTVYSGGMQTVTLAYQQLFTDLFTRGFQPTDEIREAYLVWENMESVNNVTQIQVVVK